MAASFNPELVKALSASAYLKHCEKYSLSDVDLSFCVNVSTDNQLDKLKVIYSEDPYLTAEISTELLKIPEQFKLNDFYNTQVIPEYYWDLGEITPDSKQQFKTNYLPVIETIVKHSQSFALNYDGPLEKSKELIEFFSNLLIKKSDFKGNLFIKLSSITKETDIHHTAEILAFAAKKGCLLACRNFEHVIEEAVKSKLVSKTVLEKLLNRFIAPEVNANSPEHPYINGSPAESAASECMVLLKNDGLVPLAAANAKKIAVIGPYADFKKNFDKGEKKYIIKDTVLNGIIAENYKSEILYAQGCPIDIDESDESLLSEAVWAAQQSDLVILAVGTNQSSSSFPETNDNRLPENQEKIIEEICGIGTPVILLNFSNGWVDLSSADEMCSAVFQCWNEHILCGTDIAKTISGKYVPSGKLPLTFYRVSEGSESRAAARPYTGYRNSTSEVLYPFGYGLSYASVEYYRIYLSEPKIKAGEDIIVTVFVKNKGKFDIKETVQAYIKDEEASQPVPKWQLAAFIKIFLAAGEEKKISLTISSAMMSLIDKNGNQVIEPGRFSLYVGGGQPDDLTAELYNRDCLHIGFLVE